MAGRTAKAAAKGQHAYKKIEEEIKEGALAGPLFFYGRERFLIDWAIGSIIEKFVNPAVRALDFNKNQAGELSVEQLRNQCETLPLLSEKRVVLVEDFAPLAGGKLKGFGDKDEEALLKYLTGLPETCILIFTAGTADKRRKLYKAVEKAGGCYDFKELDEKLLKAWIEKQVKRGGKTIRPAALTQLISMSGYYDKDTDYTLYNLENDIRKAQAYCDGDEIRAEDILGVISGNLETDVFAMIDSLSQGRKEEAFRLLHNLMVSGEKEYRLLALICSQLELMLSVKEMKEEGKGYEEIRDFLQIHEFRIKKASMAAGRYEMPKLRRALIKAYEVDKNIKNGVLEGRLALELLAAEL